MKSKRKKTIIVAAMTLVVAVAGYFVWQLGHGSAAVTPDAVQYPVRGVDISAHNGDIDFDKLVATDSIDFVLMKASEGTAFKDINFHANYLAARRAGLSVGAYHFFRFDASGYMQALNFLHSVRGKELDLPLVIDIEEWTNPDDRTTRSIVTQLRDMITMLEGAGYKVMLYSNKDGYNRFIVNNFDTYPLWLVSFTGAPEADWHLWQFTHHGNLESAGGNIDINTFNGSREQWDDWLRENDSQKQ